MPEQATNDARSIIETVKDLHAPQIVTLDDGTEILAVPKGVDVRSVKPLMDEYRTQPERRRGLATLSDLESFIAHATRFKAPNSAIFARRDEEAPSVTSVFDYHPEGPEIADARFLGHRGHYAFPTSEQWNAWRLRDGKTQTQRDFAAFIEERIMDIIAPGDGAGDAGSLASDMLAMLGGEIAGPSKLLEISRGLRMTETAEVANAQNLASGEVEIVFRTTHTDDKKQPLKVPNLFVIGIPVFDGDAAYRLPIRLTYRRDEGRILWTFKRYRPDVVFFDAFDRAVARVKQETGLPVFIGQPEKAA